MLSAVVKKDEYQLLRTLTNEKEGVMVIGDGDEIV